MSGSNAATDAPSAVNPAETLGTALEQAEASLKNYQTNVDSPDCKKHIHEKSGYALYFKAIFEACSIALTDKNCDGETLDLIKARLGVIQYNENAFNEQYNTPDRRETIGLVLWVELEYTANQKIAAALLTRQSQDEQTKYEDAGGDVSRKVFDVIIGDNE